MVDVGPMGTVPTDCLEPANCVDTTDCPSGARCNTALSPPRCQTLFCGPAGSLCSEDGLCTQGLGCINEVCTACTDCDGECVSLQTDRRHCGMCFNTIRPDEACVGGRAQCADAQETRCDGRCVNIQTSSSNCGACNVGCMEGSVCASGACVTVTDAEPPPRACQEVCSANGDQCELVAKIPVPLPGVSGGGAGIAVYDGDNNYAVIPDCATPPAATKDTKDLLSFVCFCSDLN